MKFDVYFDCVNGRTASLVLQSSSEAEIVDKVQGILKDNEGGTAEITAFYGKFFTIIEV